MIINGEKRPILPKMIIETEGMDMTRLIDAEALQKAVEESNYFDDRDSGLTLAFIKSASTVDRQKGWWIEHSRTTSITCSVCGFNTKFKNAAFRYCPDCGAKMEKRSDVIDD